MFIDSNIITFSTNLSSRKMNNKYFHRVGKCEKTKYLKKSANSRHQEWNVVTNTVLDSKLIKKFKNRQLFTCHTKYCFIQLFLSVNLNLLTTLVVVIKKEKNPKKRLDSVAPVQSPMVFFSC